MSDILLVKMITTQNESLLPNHQTDLYTQNNETQIINAKSVINNIFIVACVIDIIWQINARVDLINNAEAMIYIFFILMGAIFTLSAVVSCLALSKANYFATDLKPVAKISYATIALGAAINTVGMLILTFIIANKTNVDIDFYALFLVGNIFIGLGFFGRLAFNEDNY
jgi:hypothetical protein